MLLPSVETNDERTAVSYRDVSLDVPPEALKYGHYVISIKTTRSIDVMGYSIIFIKYDCRNLQPARLTGVERGGIFWYHCYVTLYRDAEEIVLRIPGAREAGEVIEKNIVRLSRIEYYYRLSLNIIICNARNGSLLSLARGLMTASLSAGLRGLASELRSRSRGSTEDEDYLFWISLREDASRGMTLPSTLNASAGSCRFVLFSTLRDIDEFGLEQTLTSLRSQSHSEWEWHIITSEEYRKSLEIKVRELGASESRITIEESPSVNLSNSTWMGHIVCGDRLADDALSHFADAIVSYPSARLLYSDEDLIDRSGRRHSPIFKPDFAPEYLVSTDYIGRMVMAHANSLTHAGGGRHLFEPTGGYEATLLIWDAFGEEAIVHVDRVLYHGAGKPDSSHDAMKLRYKALKAHFDRKNESVDINILPEFGGFHIMRHLGEPAPLVSLIVPTRDRVELLQECVESLCDVTDYSNFEVVIADNDSELRETHNYFKSLKSRKNVRILTCSGEFNYSAINNRAVATSSAKLVGLVNSDVVVISPGWLKEMVSWAVADGIGCVGAKLLYLDNTVQHGGVIVGLGHVAGHAHRHFPRDHSGYQSRLKVVQNYSAVTGACMVVRREIYEQVGGLNEIDLKIAYNDVDFCLRVREAGYRNVWTPFAELYHHESKSRGLDDVPEKRRRYLEEVRYMRRRWGQYRDPFYSRHLTPSREDFTLAI